MHTVTNSEIDTVFKNSNKI